MKRNVGVPLELAPEPDPTVGGGTGGNSGELKNLTKISFSLMMSSSSTSVTSSLSLSSRTWQTVADIFESILTPTAVANKNGHRSISLKLPFNEL